MSMFQHKRKQREAMYADVRRSVMPSKTAQQLLHDMSNMSGSSHKKITAQSAPSEAIEMVYGVMTSYVWPHPPKLAYTGMKRTDSRMATKDLNHGVVSVTATIRTPIGVTLGIDVPVEIRNGHMVEPAVMFHGGTPYIISQSSIDRIVRDNSTWGQLPTRQIFSSPHDSKAQMTMAPMRTERRTPSMFSTRMAADGLRDIIRSRGARGSLRSDELNEDRGSLR